MQQHFISDKFLTTIDGFSATGKDLLAKNLSENETFPEKPFILNTGDFARAVAQIARHKNIQPDHPDYNALIIHELKNIDFHAIDRSELYSTENGMGASKFSKIPDFEEIVGIRIAETLQAVPSSCCILLGRFGGHRFNAQVKLYLKASDEVCADRRARELADKGEDYQTAYDKLLQRIKDDLANNSNVLFPAEDAMTIVTEKLPEEVCEEALVYIKPALSKWVIG